MVNGLVVNVRSLGRRISGVERYTAEIAGRSQVRLRRVAPSQRLPALAGHIWEQLVLPTRLKQGELLWSPANSGPLAVRDQVLSLHDASVIEHPGWYHPLFAGWYRAMLPCLVRRVRRVLTVSAYSRRRILDVFGLEPGQVVAISPGVDPERFHPASKEETCRVRQRYDLKNAYLLFVGTIEPRKNLGRLFAAWEQLAPKFPGVDLVIAGSSRANFASTGLRPDLANVRTLGYIPEVDLPALYGAASICLLPSLEEGFGLTALEAMACGTPVIASDAGALPETVGSAGILVSPLDTQAWVEAIARLLGDRGCLSELSQRGRERAQLFPWEETARQVWQALDGASRLVA